MQYAIHEGALQRMALYSEFPNEIKLQNADSELDMDIEMEMIDDDVLGVDSSMIFSLGDHSKNVEFDEDEEDSEYGSESPTSGENSPISLEKGQHLFVPLYDLPFIKLKNEFESEIEFEREYPHSSIMFENGYKWRNFQNVEEEDVIHVSLQQDNVDFDIDNHNDDHSKLKLLTNDTNAVYLDNDNITDASTLYKSRFQQTHSYDEHLLGLGIDVLSSVPTPLRVDTPISVCVPISRGEVEHDIYTPIDHFANEKKNDKEKEDENQEKEREEGKNNLNEGTVPDIKIIAKDKDIAKRGRKPQTVEVATEVPKPSGAILEDEDYEVQDDDDDVIRDEDYNDKVTSKPPPRKKRGKYKKRCKIEKSSIDKKLIKKGSKMRTSATTMGTKRKYTRKIKFESNNDKKYVEEEEKFICKTCGKDFPRKSNHDSHIRLHLTIKPHVCKFCSKAFVRRSDMNRHERSLHLKTTFRCHGNNDIGEKWGCGRLYSRKDGLRKHWKSVPGHECLRGFLKLSGLNDKLDILDNVDRKPHSEKELESIIDLTRLC